MYNLHTVNCIYFKCTVPFILTNVYTYKHYHNWLFLPAQWSLLLPICFFYSQLWDTIDIKCCVSLRDKMLWFEIYIYWEMITTIWLVKTFITSHNYHVFWWWKHLKSVFLATVKYIVQYLLWSCCTLDPKNLFILKLEVCTLWLTSSCFFYCPAPGNHHSTFFPMGSIIFRFYI